MRFQKVSDRLILVLIVPALLVAAAHGASENLVTNGGFETVEKDLPGGWEVKIRGEWAQKIGASKIVSVCPDARTGRRALLIDTTGLNPAGEITDDLRTWRSPKYEIFVTQKVSGLEPNSWYLAKFHVKSPELTIDESLEFIADLLPWTIKSRKGSHWPDIAYYERRLFLPGVPTPGKEYREHVLLKETYPGNDSIEIGVRIRAPWTGKVVIDDVELVRVDPDKDMTKMEKFLAMRGALPFTSVRKLNRETTLAAGGNSSAAILIPDSDAYRSLGAKIQTRIRELTGAAPPLVTKLADVPKGAAIVALGSMMDNEFVARLHFNRYVRADALSPGPGGYVLWTVCEPYGLAKGQNAIVVAGSDEAGQKAGVDAFCELLKAKDKNLTLPYLHTVYPKRTVASDEREVPRKNWGFKWNRERHSGYARWYLPLWLKTGDLEAARLARDDMIKVADAYLENPYFQTQWDTYEVGLAWDALEEAPVFSREDRVKISNMLLGYMHMRPQAGTSGWSRMIPRLADNIPTWNHQAKGLSAVYTTGRYFDRFYGDVDARYGYYVAAARNTFQGQSAYFKPQENSGNYWLITMNFAISYYLGEWDMTFFKNGAMRRYAEYCATVCNNEGWLSGFGDTYYVYHGGAARMFGGPREVPLAFWYYRDPRMLWWLEHCKPEGYRNLYHQDVAPVEWKEMVGVKVTPLERGLYDKRRGMLLWGSGGDGTHAPTGDAEYEETFDKISFRESWEADGQYMLLEGNGRGIHSGKGTNQICKLSLLGEDLLIGSTYYKNNVRTNCSVVAAKTGDIDDPAVKGDKPWEFAWWSKLFREYPGYAALDTIADLPTTGFTRTSMRGFLAGTQWDRNVFWAKGKYFAMIDEIVPKEAGTYHVESNYSTCPHPRGGGWGRLTPRTWKLLEANRGFEVSFEKDDGTKLYILTDGTAEMISEVYKPQGINKVIVRQMRKGVRLGAGEKVTFLTLFCGDRDGGRKDYRIERLGPTEGLILEGGKAVAYFGCGQGEETKAIFPVEAKMFLLTGQTLSVVDGILGGSFFKSRKPESSEVNVPAGAAADILSKLARVPKKGRR